MSQENERKFAEALTEAVYRIKRRESKPISVIQDELGYALGRNGGSIIEYWRKGNLPPKQQDVEQLAVELVQRGNLSRPWLEEYLRCAGYGVGLAAFCDQLFPPEGREPARPGWDAGQAAPFQAPRLVSYFVGRQHEFAQLRTRLRPASASRICALVGMGGVGKTALAIQIAHAVRHSFADGVLWATAATSNPLDIAKQWAREYDYDFGQLGDLHSRAAALRSLLAPKETLIVLDDVTSVAAIQPLLPGGQGCAVLLTTRSEDVAAALSADIFHLGELSVDEGLQLLATILGETRLAAERDAAYDLCRHLHCLPLALEIAGQLLRARPRRRLADLAMHLVDLSHRLDLQISDRAVRASFDASWEVLDEPHRAAFACLAVFEGRTFTAEAFAFVAELDLYTAQDRLYTLKALSLVREEGVDRFQQHPLLAGFAGEQLGDAPGAYQRMALYYERLVHAQYSSLSSHRGGAGQGQEAQAEAQARPTHDEEPEEIAPWEMEWDNVMAAMHAAYRLQEWALLLSFAKALVEPWFRQARYTQTREGCQWADVAATALGDSQARAWVLQQWGRACLEQEDYVEATEHLEASLRLYEAQPDPTGPGPDAASASGAAETRYWQARLALERGQYGEAQEHLEGCHQIFTDLADELGLARTCYQQGLLAYYAGDLRLSRRWCEQALAIQTIHNNGDELVPILRLLADIAIEQQEYEVADDYCRRALSIAESLQNRGELAAVTYSMAVVARKQELLPEALALADRACELFEKMGARGFLAITLQEQSRVYARRGEYPLAETLGQQSLALLRELEDIFNMVYLLDHLGGLARILGQEEQARLNWQEALALAEGLVHPLRGKLRQQLETKNSD